ncbi:hypothetical protein D3C86_1764430 [compost metagenome]
MRGWIQVAVAGKINPIIPAGDFAVVDDFADDVAVGAVGENTVVDRGDAAIIFNGADVTVVGDRICAAADQIVINEGVDGAPVDDSGAAEIVKGAGLERAGIMQGAN